jgi:hypothetical protein
MIYMIKTSFYITLQNPFCAAFAPEGIETGTNGIMGGSIFSESI